MKALTHLLLISVIAVLALAVSPPDMAVAQEDDDAAQEIVALINGWRIEQGLWPLRENATLAQIAYDQASYVLSLPNIPAGGDIHLSASGADAPTRARLPKYDWTPYGDDRYTAVGEIAYVGINAAAAQRFWEGSTIHRNTLLNPAYREIGVAALPHRFGHIYMVDFGSRPDVLPAIADLRTNTLYLSNERYYRARSPWIRDVERVRLFDAEGRPLETDWLPWQLQIPIPPDAGDHIFVAYADNDDGMVLASVSLEQQTSALPTFLPSATPTRTPSPTPSRTPTPTRTAGTAVSASPTVTGTRAVSSATLTRTPTPTVSQAGSVTLLYDARSFTLLNSGQTAINVEEIVFVGQGQSFAVRRWATQWLSGSLSALPASDCLGVWSWNEASELAKPSRCRQRRSVLTISPNQLFWKQGDFEVHWRDLVLATCHTSDTSCEFVLP